MTRRRVGIHSSEIRDSCLMKCFSEILHVKFFGIQIHNLTAIGFYFSFHALCDFFSFNFCCLLFPLINALVYDNKEIWKKKKERKVCFCFLFQKRQKFGIFWSIWWNISSSINLIFLKSDGRTLQNYCKQKSFFEFNYGFYSIFYNTLLTVYYRLVLLLKKSIFEC